MANWRKQPAALVEEAIADQCNGNYPPSLEDLVAVAHKYRFQVYSDDQLSTALTYHAQRAIFLPNTKPAVMQRMLLHELAEILLRLPVAPEYFYPVSDKDEFHEAACLVEKRTAYR